STSAPRRSGRRARGPGAPPRASPSSSSRGRTPTPRGATPPAWRSSPNAPHDPTAAPPPGRRRPPRRAPAARPPDPHPSPPIGDRDARRRLAPGAGPLRHPEADGALDRDRASVREVGGHLRGHRPRARAGDALGREPDDPDRGGAEPVDAARHPALRARGDAG